MVDVEYVPPEPPPLNLPLLRKTVEHIHIPGVWDQTSWMRTSGRSECGTVGCLAGWAVELTGRYDMIFAENEEEGERYVDMVLDRATGETEFLSEVARRELGLTDDEGEYLFDGSNSMADILHLCSSIAERSGEKF